MDRIKEKYICPFTDFGFKKLFGIEPNKDLLIDFLNELLKNDEGRIQFDKWLYVLRNLSDLTKRPAKLQERIFNKLFEQSEIARYTDEEYAEYEESLKVYRDLKNVIDTAFDEGEKEGMIKGKEEGVLEGKKEMIKNMYKSGLSYEIISEISSLSIEEIKKILK